MAFKVVADAKTRYPVLEPVWISGDFDMPDPAVIANGVVFALATGGRSAEWRHRKACQPAIPRS